MPQVSGCSAITTSWRLDILLLLGTLARGAMFMTAGVVRLSTHPFGPNLEMFSWLPTCSTVVASL
jgi:hypothetical protein